MRIGLVFADKTLSNADSNPDQCVSDIEFACKQNNLVLLRLNLGSQFELSRKANCLLVVAEQVGCY